MPVYLGVSRPRALELAGEVADGVLFDGFLPPEFVERALSRVRAGAERVSRDPAEIDVAMAVVVSPGETVEEGRERARGPVALYLSLFSEIARESGLPDIALGELRQAFADRGLEGASRLVPDEVVDRLCAVGPVAVCRERIAAYRGAGVSLPVLTPLPGTAEVAIDELLER